MNCCVSVFLSCVFFFSFSSSFFKIYFYYSKGVEKYTVISSKVCLVYWVCVIWINIVLLVNQWMQFSLPLSYFCVYFRRREREREREKDGRTCEWVLWCLYGFSIISFQLVDNALFHICVGCLIFRSFFQLTVMADTYIISFDFFENVFAGKLRSDWLTNLEMSYGLLLASIRILEIWFNPFLSGNLIAYCVEKSVLFWYDDFVSQKYLMSSLFVCRKNIFNFENRFQDELLNE